MGESLKLLGLYKKFSVMDTAMGHNLMLSAARHKKDPRIAVSAGNDGFVHVFDADTGEIQGSVQLQQSDKVRGITWCEVRPDLLAIQYYQHATEFRSIESGDEESTVGRLDVNLVPAWVSAAPVGASFAAGGRMATHYRLWDDVKQAWQYTVELRKLPVNQTLYTSAMELQNACDGNTFGPYCEDRAHSTEDHNLQTLWTFLAALSNKQGRREFVRILGYGAEGSTSKESRTSVTSNEVTQLTNIMSSMNSSLPRQNGNNGDTVSDDDSTNSERFARQPELDWNRLDNSDWSVLDNLINHGEEVVIDSLLEQKDFSMAFMLARDSTSLMRYVVRRFVSEELAPSQRLFSLIATECFDQLVETFPREHWRRLLALVLMRADRSHLIRTMRRIATRWTEHGGAETIHAAFAAIIASDLELLLSANRDYSLDERIQQAIVLQKVSGANVDADYERLLLDYCEKLIHGGVSDAAWRLLSNFEATDERLLALRHDLFQICGREERTMSREPRNPRSKYVKEIASALSPSRPQLKHPVFPPSSAASSQHLPPPHHRPIGNPPVATTHLPRMPPFPSAAQYPTASSFGGYSPTPSLTTPGMPSFPGYPSTLSPPMHNQLPTVPGFNSVPTPLPPPPIAQTVQTAHVPPSAIPTTYNNYTSYSQANPPVALPAGNSVHGYVQQDRPISTVSASSTGGGIEDAQNWTAGWNDPPSLPGKKSSTSAAPVFEVNWKPLDPTPVTLPNGLPGVASGAPMRAPSAVPSQHQQERREMPQVRLSVEDQAIMDRFYHLIESVISVNRTPVALHKADEAKTRLGCELAPRLAAGRLTLATRQLLWQSCEQASKGDYRSALATCAQMVRAGGDFVEVSAFVPALKSLFSLAQSTFAR
ncbi:hypothetical protein RB195_001824 [Necator americanus]